MSSTRHNTDGRFADERYMSADAYTETRGLSGMAVAARAALLDDPAKQSLCWYIQAMSLRPGGLDKFARDLLAAHPHGWPHPLAGAIDPARLAATTLACHARQLRHLMEDTHGGDAQTESREPGRHPDRLRPGEAEMGRCLRQLVLDPDCPFPNREGLPRFKPLEHGLDRDARALQIWCQAVVPSLYDWQRRHAEQVRGQFVLTEVGRMVWETLDACLALRRMVVIDGREGIGKTAAVKAWCEAHLGAARFITLSGVINKSAVFRAIAQEIGLGSGHSRKAKEMQSRIEEVLCQSGLLLVMDESHFLFNQSIRMTSVPELIDWVDTSLNNRGVPAALICTPQFSKHLGRAEVQVGWNAGQFKRRLLRYAVLPDSLSINDLMAVAERLAPGLSPAGRKLLVGYAADNKQPLSAMSHAVDEARLLAMKDGREAITARDVQQAIVVYRIPSDQALARTLEPAVAKGRRKPAVAAQMQEGCATPAETLSKRGNPHGNQADAGAFPRREITPLRSENEADELAGAEA